MGKEIFRWRDNQDIWYYKIGVLLGTLFYIQEIQKLDFLTVLWYYISIDLPKEERNGTWKFRKKDK